MIWKTRRRTLDLSHRALVMGIVNVTPDSFSDGGQFVSASEAVAHGMKLAADGADILDIGGESTRPGAAPVPPEEELRRILPVIRELRRQSAVLLSVDTMKPSVAAAALDAGADILNDVTGFRDAEMRELAARSGAGCVVMHMQGEPRTMQQAPSYVNVVTEVQAFFALRLEQLIKSGALAEQVVFDPGIGFGKTLTHNLELLRGLDRLTWAERPLLLGTSRKSFIGAMLGEKEMECRAWPSVALTSLAREKGVRAFRVHDVLENTRALRMTEAILAAQ